MQPDQMRRDINGPMRRYINGPMRRIDGWYTKLDAEMTALIADHQSQAQIVGSVGEIGVHHGRAFVALALALRPEERAFAIDVFGEQRLNDDHSGCGDEATFRANLHRHGIDQSRVAVLQASSLQIAWPDVQRQVGSEVRLFSIDGGHTAPVVEHDFEIANAGLCDGGVVIADDYFNPGFPAVSEGIARFMVRHPDALRPFAIGDSRLFLCRPRWVETYRTLLERDVLPGRFSATTTMWGSRIAVFHTPRLLIDRLRSWRITQAVLRRRWGAYLKPAARWLLAPR